MKSIPVEAVAALRDQLRKWHSESPVLYVRPDRMAMREWVAALDALIASAQETPDGWQPIETAPKDADVFFWVVPKTPDEAYTDTSGKPICVQHPPYLLRGKLRTWGALSKATHWMPLPVPPARPEGPQED